MIGRFLRQADGQMGVAVTLMLLPIMGGVALAVDYGSMSRQHAELQSALDAASLEMAVHLYSEPNDDALRARGLRILQANLPVPAVDWNEKGATLIYHGVATDSGGQHHLSTEAVWRYSFAFPLPYAIAEHSDLRVRARVSASAGDTACVYALNHTASRALQAGGSTTVTMDGCVIASNSTALDAVYVGGSARLAADCIQSSGGIAATSGLTTKCAQNRERAWRLPDPFRDLVDPAPPILMSAGGSSSLSPGRYNNLTLNGDRTLLPGLYYIEGSLTVQGNVTGTGVTIFMKNGAVKTNGNANLSLSAPTEGPYAGMLFWSSQTNTSSHSFNGNGLTDLNGFLYFPRGDLTFNGNNGTSSTCLRIVADTIKMTGNSSMRSDCTQELGGREARVAGPPRLSR